MLLPYFKTDVVVLFKADVIASYCFMADVMPCILADFTAILCGRY